MYYPTATENRSMYDPIALTEFMMRVADYNSHEAKSCITNQADPTAVSKKTVYFGMQYGFDLMEDEVAGAEIAKVVIATSFMVKMEITTNNGSVHIEYVYDPASQERKASIRHTEIKEYRAGFPGPVTDEDVIGHVLHRLIFEGEWGCSNWENTETIDLIRTEV